MRGSPEPGSVRVIRPSVAGLLTAVFGMFEVHLVEDVEELHAHCTYDEL
jgi:hypothetical protein